MIRLTAFITALAGLIAAAGTAAAEVPYRGSYYFSQGSAPECRVDLTGERGWADGHKLTAAGACADLYRSIRWSGMEWTALKAGIRLNEGGLRGGIVLQDAGNGLFVGQDRGERVTLRSRTDALTGAAHGGLTARNAGWTGGTGPGDTPDAYWFAGADKAACTIHLEDRLDGGRLVARLGSDCGRRYDHRMTHLRAWGRDAGAIVLMDPRGAPLMTLERTGPARWRSASGYEIWR